MTDIIKNWHQVKNHINECERQYHLPLNSVTLVAVSKGFAADLIANLYNVGQLNFGENYLQHALPKLAALEQHPLIWHFLGAIQTNKCKEIAQHFSWVHSLSRVSEAKKFAKSCLQSAVTLNVCIQLKLDNDPKRAGVTLQDLPELIEYVTKQDSLKLRGFMVLPPMCDNDLALEKIFQQGYNTFAKYQNEIPSMDTLSMGMSLDFPLAIKHGASMVRVGQAIFGART